MTQQEEIFNRNGRELSLLGHLNELRIRITWLAAGLLIATIVSLIFAGDILDFILARYAEFSASGRLQTLRPTESIETYFKVALMAGGILSMPNILLQLWLFVAPGMTKAERRYVYIFMPSALLLFGLGVLFAWMVLVPAAVGFLATFKQDVFVTEWTGQEYLSFLTTMIFWLGVSFEMPIIVYFIARVGVIPAKALREQWRIALVGISVIAAAVTPSIDPITMLLTMLPLSILYLLSIGLAVIGQRQFERSMAY